MPRGLRAVPAASSGTVVRADNVRRYNEGPHNLHGGRLCLAWGRLHDRTYAAIWGSTVLDICASDGQSPTAERGREELEHHPGEWMGMKGPKKRDRAES